MAFFVGPYHTFDCENAPTRMPELIKSLLDGKADPQYRGRIKKDKFFVKRKSKEGFSPIVKGIIAHNKVRIRLGVSWLAVAIFLLLALFTGINLGQYFMYQFGFRGAFILFGPAPWLGTIGVVLLISFAHQVFQERMRELEIWRTIF